MLQMVEHRTEGNEVEAPPFELRISSVDRLNRCGSAPISLITVRWNGSDGSIP